MNTKVQGQCPQCGSLNIEYDTIEMSNDMRVYFPAVCTDCKLSFEEHYDLIFDEHVIPETQNL